MVRVPAPAKLNLFLRVFGRRPDGYHEIETVFERLDLADALTFQAQPETLTLTCDDPALPCTSENLILKAAAALQRATGTRAGARIHLTKRIPIAAGLGGGSSDAAATLLGLDRLWGLRLGREALLPLAAQLGSDVPFFLHESPFAIGRGRGDVCEPISASGRLAHVLVVPPERLSTKEVYAGMARARAGDFSLTARPPSLTIMQHALCNGSLSELASGVWNDLEPEAIRRCPIIASIQTQLRQAGCVAAGLSGSGSSVFGLCRDAAHAQEVCRRVSKTGDGSMPRRNETSISVIRTGGPFAS